MRIADAFAAIKLGEADAAYREDWAEYMVCVTHDDGKGERRIYLRNTTTHVEYAYWPHSIDVMRDDWGVLSLADV